MLLLAQSTRTVLLLSLLTLLPARSAPTGDLHGGSGSAQAHQEAGANQTSGPGHVAPPRVFRGIYLTSWSAGVEARIDRVVELARAGAINTVVIDVKDATGYVDYDTSVPEVAQFAAGRRTIPRLGQLVDRLHAEGLYVIARIVVFTDTRLAMARPELAVHRESLMTLPAQPYSVATLWRDKRRLAWIDPSATAAWRYIASIAKDVVGRGVDELNFDYVRFPSDGNLKDMRFPFSGSAASKHAVLRMFFAYLRSSLPSTPISVDFFGLATVNTDDLGVGQVIEDAFEYFDYVCPMVYPSHFATGFLGFANPAQHPRKVVYYSMKSARERLHRWAQQKERRVKLRPWLQDFNLGAVYTAASVKAQIEATQAALQEDYCGFTLWNPSNVYTVAALASAS